MINLGFNKLSLNDQLLIILSLKLIKQLVENLQSIVIFLLFEIQLGQLVFDLHSQEGSAFLVAPVNDIFGQINEWVVSVSTWKLETHIKHRTDDLSGLALW